MVTQALTRDKSLVANLGEIKVSKDPEMTLSCLGVGSCIALCMYDSESGVGGIAHIVLPSSDNGMQSRGNATKYADVAVPELLQQMRELGAVRSHLVTKISGGSQMFKSGGAAVMNTGERNIEAVKKVLADEVIRIKAEDVGGTKGRTVRIYVGSGKVTVKTVGGPENEL
jgi:chemotaxis protein CheD